MGMATEKHQEAIAQASPFGLRWQVGRDTALTIRWAVQKRCRLPRCGICHRSPKASAPFRAALACIVGQKPVPAEHARPVRRWTRPAASFLRVKPPRTAGGFRCGRIFREGAENSTRGGRAPRWGFSASWSGRKLKRNKFRAPMELADGAVRAPVKSCRCFTDFYRT